MAKLIGIDVGGTTISAGIVSNGKVLQSEEVKTPKTKKKFFDILFALINYLKNSKIKSIGIGFPAPIVNGTVMEVQNMPFLNNTNIKQIIEKKYKVKCFVENDANAFALAESKENKNVVGITLGTGLGCGIVVNGKIYSGNTGGAGEISKIPFGKTNLENTVNERFIEKTSGRTGKEIYDSAKKGNKTALKVWKQYGKNLGKVLSIVVNTLDPELIVLGGKLSNAYPFFKNAMNEELKKNIFKNSFNKLKIRKSKLKNSAILGTASLC